MWGDVGSRMPVKPSHESIQDGGGETAAMEHTGHGEWSPELLDVFPGEGRTEKFPVAECLGRVMTRTEMRVYFVHWHILDTVVILEEGNFPHPRCSQCEMLVLRRSLNRRHPGTAQFNKGAEQKRRPLVETETQEITDRSFEAYGAPIKM